MGCIHLHALWIGHPSVYVLLLRVQARCSEREKNGPDEGLVAGGRKAAHSDAGEVISTTALGERKDDGIENTNQHCIAKINGTWSKLSEKIYKPEFARIQQYTDCFW